MNSQQLVVQDTDKSKSTVNRLRVNVKAIAGILVISLALLAVWKATETASKTSVGNEITISAPVEASLSEVELLKSQAASAARWELMGRYYSDLASAARVRGAAADQARWEALGEQYASLAGVRLESAAATDQARWEAMGEHYARLTESRPERAVAADQARWEAMGEFYASLSQK